MSHDQNERHPFLDDLTADAELTSSVLRGTVTGRDEIRLAVNSVGTFYASQTPTFLEVVGSRLFLEYEAVLTIGEKLFAVPWEALTLDTVNKRFTLNIDKERIENAPGFDTDHWPNMANQTWASQIHSYYGTGSSTNTNLSSTLD